jgi:predicted amidohydrolase
MTVYPSEPRGDFKAITEEFATTSNNTLTTTTTTTESDINVFRLKNHVKNFTDIINNSKRVNQC